MFFDPFEERPLTRPAYRLRFDVLEGKRYPHAGLTSVGRYCLWPKLTVDEQRAGTYNVIEGGAIYRESKYTTAGLLRELTVLGDPPLRCYAKYRRKINRERAKHVEGGTDVTADYYDAMDWLRSTPLLTPRDGIVDEYLVQELLLVDGQIMLGVVYTRETVIVGRHVLHFLHAPTGLIPWADETEALFRRRLRAADTLREAEDIYAEGLCDAVEG